MNIDKEHLEAEQKRLLALRENLIAQANACGGAIEFIGELIKYLDVLDKSSELSGADKK